jgi:hypothetical protein
LPSGEESSAMILTQDMPNGTLQDVIDKRANGFTALT